MSDNGSYRAKREERRGSMASITSSVSHESLNRSSIVADQGRSALRSLNQQTFVAASAEAIKLIESVGLEDEEKFHSVQFDDHLVIVSDLGTEVGELTVSVTAAQYRNVGECLKVTAVSRGLIDGVPCGTTVTAFVSKHLLTLEQQHHEFVRLDKHPVDRRTLILRKDDHFLVELFVMNEETTHHRTRTFSHDEMRGVLPEGSSIILERLLIMNGLLKESIELASIDSEIQLCYVTYTPQPNGAEVVEDIEVETICIERTLFPYEKEPCAWRSSYTKEGLLVKRYQKGAPITMKIKSKGALLTTAIDEENEKTVVVLRPLNWQEDIEMSSKFSDRQEELRASHNAYLREHPDAQNLVADFLQLVLIRRPDDVIAFAANYFGAFSNAAFWRAPAPCQLNSTRPEAHPACRTNQRIQFLSKSAPEEDN